MEKIRGRGALPLTNEQREIITAAEEIAALMNQTWPQMAEDGTLNYSIAGSLSVALLAGSGSYVDIDGRQIDLPIESLRCLRESLHLIHDIDYENSQSGTFPDEYDPRADNFLDQAARLASQPEMKLDDIDSINLKAPVVAVETSGGKFFVTRLDYQVGFKTLGVFFNFNRKPEQLNYEVPLLVASAVVLYGEEYIWKLIGHFFALNDEVEGRYKKWGLDLTTSCLIEKVASDPQICPELKMIMSRGIGYSIGRTSRG
jgi:hypothetical protein